MLEIRQTDRFASWLGALRDDTARARIEVRVRRLAMGNPGDVAPVGEGVSEPRIDCGPGNRVYFTRQDNTVILLLCGGDKRTQARDILAANKMRSELE